MLIAKLTNNDYIEVLSEIPSLRNFRREWNSLHDKHHRIKWIADITDEFTTRDANRLYYEINTIRMLMGKLISSEISTQTTRHHIELVLMDEVKRKYNLSVSPVEKLGLY